MGDNKVAKLIIQEAPKWLEHSEYLVNWEPKAQDLVTWLLISYKNPNDMR